MKFSVQCSKCNYDEVFDNANEANSWASSHSSKRGHEVTIVPSFDFERWQHYSGETNVTQKPHIGLFKNDERIEDQIEDQIENLKQMDWKECEQCGKKFDSGVGVQGDDDEWYCTIDCLNDEYA